MILKNKRKGEWIVKLSRKDIFLLYNVLDFYISFFDKMNFKNYTKDEHLQDTLKTLKRLAESYGKSTDDEDN